MNLNWRVVAVNDPERGQVGVAVIAGAANGSMSMSDLLTPVEARQMAEALVAQADEATKPPSSETPAPTKRTNAKARARSKR